MGHHQDRAHDAALIVGLAAERAGVVVSDPLDPTMGDLLAHCAAAGIDAGTLFAAAEQAVS